MAPSTLRLHTGLLLAALLLPLAALRADPLTKQYEIDFGKDVASRNLKGLATRSDGRVLSGPVFTDLDGAKLGDILWTLHALRSDQPGQFHYLVGTGPEGRVQEVAFNAQDSSYTVREVAKVTEAQATAVLPLGDHRILIGTSPSAALYVAGEGKLLARVPLPADSIFDFLALPDGTVLAGTGNPGRIYRIDPAKLAKAGLTEGKASDEKLLAGKGVTLFGEIRDRNVRRLIRLEDGRIVAGSAPKGNVYAFAAPTIDAPAQAAAPMILQENRDAEVVELLPTDDGGFYAALVTQPGDSNRLAKPKPAPEEKEEKDFRPVAFAGRSTIVRFPADGFPETIVAKSGLAFYRLARHGDWLITAAGENGDTLGYDPVARRSLLFAGSGSAQLNDLAPLDAGRFLVLRNNAPGLAVLSFAPAATRELETKRLDLGTAGTLGLLRFARMHGVEPAALKLEARVNFGSDEIEGWSPWTALPPVDGGYSAAGLRGRYFKLRLTVPADAAPDFQLDKATVFFLPQNHRPQLADFRIFPPNLALVPQPEMPPAVNTTLAQILNAKDDAGDKRHAAFLSSALVPQPHAQLIYWHVTDVDGDTLSYTLSLRPDKSDTWTDLAVDTADSYAQFDTSALPEGGYFTRLTVKEQSPRPEKDRLSYAFETDFLTLDHTPPVIHDASARKHADRLVLTVAGRDALSQLSGAEFILNNGTREQTEHPADGVLDGKSETFVVEIPAAKTAGATSVEIILYDESGNSTSRRLPLN